MAKKKQAEYAAPVVELGNEQEAEIKEENIEAVETEAKHESTEAEETTQENSPENETDGSARDQEKVEAAVNSLDEIPDSVLAYLKRHTEIHKVYIDKLGGVFSENTSKVFLKDAVLYQNPFYKQ